MSNESIPIRLTGPLCKAMPIGTELVGDEGYWKGASYVKTTPSTWAMFMGRPTPADLWEAVEARRNNLSPYPSGLAYVYEPPARPGATSAPDDPEVLIGDSYFRLSEVPAYAERLLASLTEEQQKSKELHIALTEMAPAPSLPTQDGDDDEREAAPLDPSKVKAGDTVTLTRGKAVVTDEVRQVRPHVPNDTAFGIVLDQDPGTLYRWVGGSPEHWTLTAHQPAPEPEPQWPSGGFAEATVNGETVRGLVGREPGSGDGPVFVYWNEFAGHVSVTGAVPADVRPLVVIDPATTSWDWVKETFAERGTLSPGNVAGLRAVLAGLGVEVTS